MKCASCKGHGADPLSDNVNWLPCGSCGGSGQAKPPPASSGKTGRRHRMRCSRCKGRFTLKRHPDDYVRAVRCPEPRCKSLNVYSCEAARRRELRRQERCQCNAYPFPHRAGSLTFCEANPAWSAGFDPSDDDIELYQRVLDTPRSACR